MTSSEFSIYCKDMFGCDISILYKALESSPSSRGYIMGALSEVVLQDYLECQGYEVLRIVEKPSGGFRAKNEAARGDFYVRKLGSQDDCEWLVVECKGLKSNSEFRGKPFPFSNPEKVFRYLKKKAFPKKGIKRKIYEKGFECYEKAKMGWEEAHPKSEFPPFSWSKDVPGPESFCLAGLWENENALKAYVESLPSESFQEKAYRGRKGALALLQTHKPSTRVAPKTEIKQAAPLVTEFSVLAVDLYLRTGVHEFAFMNPLTISHSPTSPEHLYQNYTIDILIPGLKPRPRFSFPWYDNFTDCIEKTKPPFREIDPTQVDSRG